MTTCTFCEIISGSPAHIFYQDTFSAAILDKRPLFKGHTLLLPKKHIHTMADLLPEETCRLFETARVLTIAIKKAMKSEGTFVAVNNTVSQSIPHLHIHIVPRTRGDGLKGFFWPRTKYNSEEEMTEVGNRIRRELSSRTGS